jgi:hypothetical protein
LEGRQLDGLERWSPNPLGYRSEAASVGGLFHFNPATVAIGT